MLPEGFKKKMKTTLGDEYDAFIGVLEEHDPIRAFRSSLIKTDGKDPFGGSVKTEPIPYVENGYILRDDIKIGSTPEHHSGMIYVQDPGAMSTVAALDISPSLRVADLCAAPGGKSSQIAERLGDDGFLLSNEYVPKRAKIIVGNFERLGVKNAAVTSLDTAELAKFYPNFFDLVIVDAPCSGEGMFRKSDEALEEWSEENVLRCAQRQKQIIKNGAAMVRPGGYLLYSTCTYSEEENEEVVSYILSERDDLSLRDVKEELRLATRGGIAREGYPRDIAKCRRFYPHITPGEGQFLALFKKDEGAEAQTNVYKDNQTPLSKSEERATGAFLREVLGKIPKGRLVKVGSNIVLIQHGCPLPPHSVFMTGVLIGEMRGDIIRPSHQFFSAFGGDFLLKVDLDGTDGRLDRYLHGEEIDTDVRESGWCAVTYRGVPLGGGKISGGRVKNHYPKGLRIN